MSCRTICSRTAKNSFLDRCEVALTAPCNRGWLTNIEGTGHPSSLHQINRICEVIGFAPSADARD